MRARHLGAPVHAAGLSAQALSLDGVDDAVTFASDVSIAWGMGVRGHASYAALNKRRCWRFTGATAPQKAGSRDAVCGDSA